MNFIAHDLERHLDGSRSVRSVHGRNVDIINAIHRDSSRAIKQLADTGKRFFGGSRTETARNIWNYLRSLNYIADPHLRQQIKSPARLATDGTGDCKSFSLFALGALSANGIPARFRYANYNGSDKPSHIYVVAQDEQGRDIILDGVYHEFNAEKPPTKFFDYDMNVISLNGTNDTYNGYRMNNPIRSLGDGKFQISDLNPSNIKQALTEFDENEDMEFMQQLLNILPPTMVPLGKSGRYIWNPFYIPFRVLLIPLFYPGRRLYIAMLEGNYQGISSDFAKPENQFKFQLFWRFWFLIGGQEEEVINAMNKGKSKPPEKFFEAIVNNFTLGGIYGDPVTASAIAAAAAEVIPILGATSVLLVSGSKLIDSVKKPGQKEREEIRQSQAGGTPLPTWNLSPNSAGGGGGGNGAGSDNGKGGFALPLLLLFLI